MKKYLAIWVVASAMPVLSQAAVTYGNQWAVGTKNTFYHTLEAPAGKYRLDIQASDTAPITVYHDGVGKQAVLLRLNQGQQGNSGSVEIPLRATKPGLAYGYARIRVQVGVGQKTGSGRYQIQLTPLF